MSTRRSFLRLTSSTLALTAVPKLLAQRAGTPVFSNAGVGAYTQGSLTRTSFEKLTGSRFRVFLEDGSVSELVLLSVSSSSVLQTKSAAASQSASTAATGPAGSSSAATASRTNLRLPTADKCFLVRFDSGSTVVPQGAYTLDHATLGSFTVFLVPGVDPASGRETCTSTFNYL